MTEGRAYIVTDLHGVWEPYAFYRDDFLRLHARGEADILVFLGDIIHGYGPAEQDDSLPMLLDIMRLQAELGPQTVVMLLGNHELPHIYGVSLSKGELLFTPRFEHALGDHRAAVIEFLEGLPFLVRTPGGVMLTHAGAAPSAAMPEAAARLLDFSHRRLLAEAERLLSRQDVLSLLHEYLNMDVQQYEVAAWQNLAVTGPHDPRYWRLLRALVVSSLEPEWSLLWDFFFTQCELILGARQYERVVERFLELYSVPGIPQRVLVSGHIVARGGCSIVGRNQLRLASWMHAVPHHAGSALLFDVRTPVGSPDDLLSGIRRIR